MRHFIKTVLLAAFFCISSSLYGNTQFYKVFIDGYEAGTSKIVKSILADGSEKIELTSLIDIHILIHIKLKFTGYIIRKNKVLQEGSSTIYNNGSIHSATKISILDDSNYHVLVNDNAKTIAKEKMALTGYDMYYFTPSKIEDVFMLNDAEISKITKLNESTYEIDDDGVKVTYTYNKNEIAKSVKFFHQMYNVEMKLES
ncbi:hypothetical protein DNU06_02605 [Putridiphycobacter roseus]|uniref:Uncharacterized protein n=1 Tax=Putridiphycobacter roseus TaxID=2219161 RepID=A0A2W1NVC8_9FLAO|nr:DUF6134 family protein [Putridiphycobacter roseus]PZE18738.1 hypothetical protein DNU06_02605 [Putridiphycobacter roseus]